MKAKVIDESIMRQVYEKDGWLYWAISKSGIQKHDLAGNLNYFGYYDVKINDKTYKAHRILYQIYNNVILESEQLIDHINGIKTDNRKENLRLCTKSQNCMNKKVRCDNKTTGIKNISILKNKSGEECYYRIKITKNSVENVKLFKKDLYSLDDVIKIRDIMLVELHKEFLNKG